MEANYTVTEGYYNHYLESRLPKNIENGWQSYI
jgi:hypothetical protein